MAQVKFKVGDRVVVYGKSGNLKPIKGIGIIEDFLEDGNIVRFDKNKSPSLFHKYEPDTGGWDLTVVHAIQCRRLFQKSKPLEIYLNEYKNGFVNSSVHESLVKAIHASEHNANYVRTIKFIEAQK